MDRAKLVGAASSLAAVAVLVTVCGACKSRPRAADESLSGRYPAPSDAARPADNGTATATATSDARSPEPDVISAATEGVWTPPEVDGDDRELTVKTGLRGVAAADAPVFVARGEDPDKLIKRVFAALNPRIPRDARVVIKVNIGGFDRIRKNRPDNGVKGRITNPELVRALIAELRRRGVGDMIMADGRSGTREDFAKLVEVSGYGDLAAETGVAFVDLNHYGADDPRPRPWRMILPWAKHVKRDFLLSDDLVNPERRTYLIDVPKLKAHRFAVMTMSIKNLMGAIMVADEGATSPPHRRRWRMHRELSPWLKAWKKTREDDRARYRRALATFSERLADLYGVLTPDLVIIEGLPAMQGDGFARVKAFDKGVVIASRNGCYADYIGAEYFGLHDSDVLEAELGVRMPPAIAAVAERYYGGVAALRNIAVRGDVAWRGREKPLAWFKAMAPFELNAKPR